MQVKSEASGGSQATNEPIAVLAATRSTACLASSVILLPSKSIRQVCPLVYQRGQMSWQYLRR